MEQLNQKIADFAIILGKKDPMTDEDWAAFSDFLDGVVSNWANREKTAEWAAQAINACIK